MIKLSELLKLRGLTEYKEIKIVRHLDNRIDIKRLYRLGYFDAYQCGQSKDVFNCKRIISTIGEENNRAVFCGIYDVISKRPGLHSDMPAGYPYPDQYQDGGFLYTLNKLSGFDDFENRVVIDWGPAALAWHQWFYDNDKDIFEILPSGYVMEWPGYSNVILNHHELSLVIKNPKSNPKWFSSLSSVGGVYLILDLNDGKQYIGSAIGKDGIWGRWKQYAENGHGGNKKLIEITNACTDLSSRFQYSLLQTVPLNTTKNEIVYIENIIKEKLGSRAFGLNEN